MKVLPARLAMLLLAGAMPFMASCVDAQSRTSGATAMPPTVSGAAGPYAHVSVTITTTRDGGAGTFSGSVRTPDGRTLPLAGPSEPADLFFLEPKAVMFTPIDRSRANGIVILYNSSQIGPQNGTDHRALVYRLTATEAVRQPTVEARLEGAANAAAARARLAKLKGAK